MVGAILWDMDGTLVDSSKAILASANLALEGHGLLPFRAHELVPRIGMPIREIFKQRSLDPAVLDKLLPAYRASYARQPLESLRPYPGVFALVTQQALKGGVNAIVTTKAESVARAVLQVHGVDGLFGAIVGDDGRRPLKPSPAPVREACRQAGVAARDAVMVGDTLHDLEAARGAGVTFIGVAWGYGSPDALAENGAHVCLNAMDLANALGLAV